MDRRRAARPGDRRAQDLPVRLHRRLFPGSCRLPLGALGGHRPPGGRAAHRLSSRGVPRGCYLDNGSAMVSKQLLRACASLGTVLVHSRPGSPKVGERSKILRDRPHPVPGRDRGAPAPDLEELNRLFTAWVETVYHRRIHSETGEAPIECSWPGAADAPEPREAARGLLVVRDEQGDQGGHGGAARQRLRGRRRPCRIIGRGRLRPLRPHEGRDPVRGPPDGPGHPGRGRPPRPPPGPARGGAGAEPDGHRLPRDRGRRYDGEVARAINYTESFATLMKPAKSAAGPGADIELSGHERRRAAQVGAL